MPPDMYLNIILASRRCHDIIEDASFGTELRIRRLAIGNHSRNTHLHVIRELGSIFNVERRICVENVAHGEQIPIVGFGTSWGLDLQAQAHVLSDIASLPIVPVLRDWNKVGLIPVAALVELQS